MTISELIRELEVLKTKHGDLPVRVQSLSHVWAPEPTVRRDGNKHPIYVLLNP